MDDVKEKLINFNDVIMQGGSFGNNTKQLIPEEKLVKVLSFDDASKQLESFNTHVVQGGMKLDDYFEKYQKGNTVLKNYVTTTNQQEQSTQGLIKASQDARAAQIAQNEAIKASTLSAKAGAIALKGLAIAGNMLVFWGISKGIEIVTKAIDKNINRVKYANETLADSKSKYDETTQSIEDLQKEIDDCRESLEDLQRQADNGTISVSDEEQLNILKETNEELERQLKVKQELQLIAAEEAVNNADKTLGVYHQSKYKIDEFDSDHDYEFVTPSEELQISIDEYNRLSEAIDNLNSKRDAGNISAEKYNEVLSKLNSQQLDARKRANEMYTILNNSKTSYDDYVKIGGQLSDTNEKNYSVVSDGISIYENFIDTVDTTIKSVEKLNETQNSTSDKTDIQFSDIFSLKDSKNEPTDLGKLNEEIDSFQSAYKGLKEVMDSYNESGEFTLDQVQQIISYGGDYLKYLMDENGNLQLNEEALNKVAVARINEMRAKALSNLMDNLEKITDEESALKYLETQLYDTATAYDDLTASRIKAWSENALENGISQKTIDKVVKNFENQASAINEMFDNINISSITTKATKTTETALDRIKNKYKELTDVIGSNVNLIKSQISLLEAQEKEVGKAYYEELINQSATKINVLNKQFSELRQQFLNTPKNTEEWLELNAAILETQNTIITTKTEMAEYQKTLDNMKWDRLEEKFESLSDIIESNSSLIESQISLLETQGSTVGRGYYDELISQTEKKIALLTDRYKTLNEQILTVDEGSDKWIELNQSIFEIQKSLIEAKEDIEKFQNSIDELHWNTLNDITDAIKGISDEAGNITDLLNLDDIVDDDGNYTKDAITALAMYGEQLESAQYLINKYSDEMDYLNEEYIKGNITTEEYNEKMKELNELQWDSVDAYNAAKKAIIDLRKNGIEEEIDALEELYDARKKAWEQEKDQYDWEKTVTENETNISKLKDQIAELQNDNSLAGTKKRKELEDELAKLESDWEDTLYDHVYDERNDQLDAELEEKKKALESTLDDEEQLVADSIDLVNNHASEVLENLNELSEQYGIQISKSLTEPFKDGENALSRYSTQFTQASSSFATQLDNTAMKIYAVQIDADNASVSVLNMFSSVNGTLDNQLLNTSGKIDQLRLDADLASISVVNMFNSTNGTLLEQLSLVRGAIESIQSAADSAYQSIVNMMAEQAKSNVSTPSSNTGGNNTISEKSVWSPTITETAIESTGSQNVIKAQQNADEAQAAANKAQEKADEEKKKLIAIKGKAGSKASQVQYGEKYASGTKSARKGINIYDEEGLGSEVILTKDGVLKQFEGGEHVFNSEQVEKLWNLSKNLQYATPNVAMPDYSKLLSSVNARNQSVNVEQKFDALIKVDGDMTPDVLQQIRNDKNIKKDIKNLALEGFVEAYETRGYRIR